MKPWPRRSATALEYVYVAALLTLAVMGALAPDPPLPDVSTWSGPFPVVQARTVSGPDVPVDGSDSDLPSVPVHSSIDIEVLTAPPRGDPFDAVAAATFVNAATGERYGVEAFYVGGRRGSAVYRFRFTPTSPGSWSFTTTSDLRGLDGISGTLRATAGAKEGVMTGVAGRFSSTAADGSRAPTTYNVYGAGGRLLNGLGDLPRTADGMVEALSPVLDEVAGLGFDALHVAVNNEWFSLGDPRWDRHGRVQPDPATFRLLETLLAAAHDRGLFVHFWMWGDESRRYTPLGLQADPLVPGDSGGATGIAFDRLLRYIAARLGPLPNWTMSYGFDLDEWADESDVVAWSQRLTGLLPLQHLLTATEEGSGPRTFDLSGRRLAVVSRDLDPYEMDVAPFDLARDQLKASGGRPVIFEARYPLVAGEHADGDTLRLLWGYAMAGGVGAIVDRAPEVEVPAGVKGAYRTFRRFWEGRMPDGSASARRLATGELVLVSAEAGRGVLYAEQAGSVSLSEVPDHSVVVAVDARKGYEELQVDAAQGVWRAPAVSDWALAFAPAE